MNLFPFKYQSIVTKRKIFQRSNRFSVEYLFNEKKKMKKSEDFFKKTSVVFTKAKTNESIPLHEAEKLQFMFTPTPLEFRREKL